MARHRPALATCLAGLLLCIAASAQARDTEAQVRQAIIQDSISSYQAGGRPCACPYNSARNGNSCGGRSAYSRPGGAAPICFDQDVTPAMIQQWRARHP